MKNIILFLFSTLSLNSYAQVPPINNLNLSNTSLSDKIASKSQVIVRSISIISPIVINDITKTISFQIDSTSLLPEDIDSIAVRYSDLATTVTSTSLSPVSSSNIPVDFLMFIPIRTQGGHVLGTLLGSPSSFNLSSHKHYEFQFSPVKNENIGNTILVDYQGSGVHLPEVAIGSPIYNITQSEVNMITFQVQFTPQEGLTSSNTFTCNCNLVNDDGFSKWYISEPVAIEIGSNGSDEAYFHLDDLDTGKSYSIQLLTLSSSNFSTTVVKPSLPESNKFKTLSATKPAPTLDLFTDIIPLIEFDSTGLSVSFTAKKQYHTEVTFFGLGGDFPKIIDSIVGKTTDGVNWTYNKIISSSTNTSMDSLLSNHGVKNGVAGIKVTLTLSNSKNSPPFSIGTFEIGMKQIKSTGKKTKQSLTDWVTKNKTTIGSVATLLFAAIPK